MTEMTCAGGRAKRVRGGDSPEPTSSGVFGSPYKLPWRASLDVEKFLMWTCAGTGVVLFVVLLVSGRISILIAAGISVALVGLVVLFTLNGRARFLVLYFINACLLSAKPRFLGDIDLAVVGSMVALFAAAFAMWLGGNPQVRSGRIAHSRSSFRASQFALIGFAGLSVISTISNAQGIAVLLPWLNGILLTLMASRAPSIYLPSFGVVRRTVLVAGLATVLYDLYLLGSGKAVNIGPFNSGRFLGSVGDYELLAEFYGALVLLALSAVLYDESGRWRVIAGIVMVPFVIVMIATESRGPLVILCVVIPVFLCMSALQHRELAGRIFRVVAVLALVIVVSLGTFAATPLFERLLSTQFGSGFDSTLNRAGVWDYFTQLPEFVGLGLAGNGFEYPYESIGTYPHSLYLWLLWSSGWIGLGFFVIVVGVQVSTLAQGVFARKTACLSAAAVLIFVLADEIKIEAARNSATVSFLWVVIAMAVLAGREQRTS